MTRYKSHNTAIFAGGGSNTALNHGELWKSSTTASASLTFFVNFAKGATDTVTIS